MNYLRVDARARTAKLSGNVKPSGHFINDIVQQYPDPFDFYLHPIPGLHPYRCACGALSVKLQSIKSVSPACLIVFLTKLRAHEGDITSCGHNIDASWITATCESQ